MQFRRFAVLLLLLLLLPAGLACSSGSGGQPAGGDVSGAWCGLDVSAAPECVRNADAATTEPIYAELTQAGNTVTGQSCEYYMAGCYDIENGSLAGGVLSFDYTFGVDRVDAHLTLSSDGRSLAGTYASTKCLCDVPVTLHRLP